MKKILSATACVLILGGTTIRLYTRAQEERADRRVTLLVDWAEVRDEASRQGMTDEVLLERLHQAGANALLVGASTVQDYAWQNFSFSNKALAQTVQRQFRDRGIVWPVKNWERFKDADVGFNPDLLGKARQAGFELVLRVNNDPWLPKEKLFAELSEIAAAHHHLGFLLNTDEVPGDPEALPDWIAFLLNQNFVQLLFEFHPTKASLKAATHIPQATFRAHTIASNELKDLTPDQERSRWRRAVEERSCRFLLFHISPNDSLASFLETVYGTRQFLTQQGWEIAWPRPRTTWVVPSGMLKRLNPILALLVAILAPVLALRAGLVRRPWNAFFSIVVLSLAGACTMSALADNPLTRIEVVPFHGVKLAFALAWLGSFAVLYPREEIKSLLYQNLRRVDVVAGFIGILVVGYFLMRTGNAGSGWKAGWEQGLRDHLEDLLVARPRFKEFAIGYPLLVLGLHSKEKTYGRLLIGLGMIGPISMINTFCHLHSPLYLAFWRSMNGILIGAFIGAGLVRIKKWASL